ncbi:MAG: hypothetical protein ACI9O5_000330 [Algoriphagus sp.]|jgi:hypothetical protein
MGTKRLGNSGRNKNESTTKPIRNAGFWLNGRLVHLMKSANTLIWYF